MVGGFAEAAGHKIGKNLVVTKSIKKNAVTGSKVKDGSLTGADLAPARSPVPTWRPAIPRRCKTRWSVRGCSCVPDQPGPGALASADLRLPPVRR